MPRAGAKAANMALRDKRGQMYVGGVDAWHTGIPGLFITRIPEEPTVYTVMHFSGLRIGTSRFHNVEAGCKLVHEVFDDKVDFTQKARELRQDPKFHHIMNDFILKAQQVEKDWSKVTKIDLAADIMEGGKDAVNRRFRT